MSHVNLLGDFLRSYRQVREMTAQDTAQRCQIPVSVVLDLEHGDRPDAETLRAISEGLDIPLVDVHRLMQGEAVPMPMPGMPDPALEADEPADDDGLDRSPTILEASRGLGPAQIEKVMDYIQLLKLAEKGHRRTTRS